MLWGRAPGRPLDRDLERGAKGTDGTFCARTPRGCGSDLPARPATAAAPTSSSDDDVASTGVFVSVSIPPSVSPSGRAPSSLPPPVDTSVPLARAPPRRPNWTPAPKTGRRRRPLTPDAPANGGRRTLWRTLWETGPVAGHSPSGICSPRLSATPRHQQKVASEIAGGLDCHQRPSP